jgi:UDP-N-acetylglucosamine acyltransferase
MSVETGIHPSAVIEDGAVIGVGVRIGPFCYVGAEAVLGDGVELMSHITVTGATTIGEGTRVFPQAVLGCEPQNLKHKGGRTTLEIGRNNLIREGVTMHRGSDTGTGRTIIGNDCFFLAFSHVAHDCVVGDHVTMTQGAVMGGHCEIGDHAIISGLSALHQFVRIGHHAFVGGMTGMEGDLIPYGMATGNRARLRGLNIVGMRRSGMPRDEIYALRSAYRKLFDPARTVAENAERIGDEYAGSAAVADVLAFVAERANRHFCVPEIKDRSAGDEADDTA